MNNDLPFAPSCERNKEVILKALEPWLKDCQHVLEIGSGTGQHAVAFAEAMPHLRWIPSDLLENLAAINAWRQHAQLTNVDEPLCLDVTNDPWPDLQVDAVFTANTLHIMPWSAVQALFAALPRCLAPRGLLMVYGPFNYGGEFTSPSNAEFDQWLKMRNPLSGIRDYEALENLAAEVGVHLIRDISMPANNRLLIWQRPIKHGVSDTR